MALVAHSEDRYLRSPRLVAADGGGARLYAIAYFPTPFKDWTETPGMGEEQVLCFNIAGDGTTLDCVAVGERQPGIARLQPTASEGAHAYTHEGELPEHADRDGAHEVQVTHAEGRSRVVLSFGARTVTVFDGAGMAAAPTVRVDRASDGAWVAFHHNIREDNDTPDIAKWIALRFVSRTGEVFEPACTMLDRDRDAAGEEQSFEYPAIEIGDDGAVAIFGRGSHNYFRQDLTADGFGPRRPLTDGVWGSRGRRIGTCTLSDGAVLVAHRERKGIELQRLDAVTGGRPPLRSAAVRVGQPMANPPRPRAERLRTFDERVTFFGDIQQHSAHSDGVGSAEEAYLRARDHYGDDFVALTDHESFLGKRTGPGEWTYLQDVADAFEQPGRFATLIAYEWTGKMYPGPGHKCVYLPRRDMRLISRDELPEGRDIVQAIKGMGGMTSPHHIGWTGCDEEGHDPLGQPVWEICSCHGCYEHADHPLGQRGEHTHQLVDAMLKKGLRFGFSASSDSHGLLYHHGEARKRDPYRTGLTAVQCDDLSRDKIFEAIASRRCYATSGAKIELDFHTDGHPMGSELEAGHRTFEARCKGTSEVERIEFVSPTGVVAAADGDGLHAALKADVTAPYVYARVVQRDGEMAWSSPIFMGE